MSTGNRPEGHILKPKQAHSNLGAIKVNITQMDGYYSGMSSTKSSRVKRPRYESK